MKRILIAACAVVFLLAASAASGQGQPQTPPTYEQMLTRNWKAVHNKILEMAKDFPEDKFDSRPHPDSRTVLDELRHVTIGLEMSTATLKGESFDYMARVKQDETKPKTRESVVGEMEAAMQISFSEVDKSVSPRLIGWLEHQGEHYGKLVTLYRMNNRVPPATRAAEERARQRQQQQPAKQEEKKP